MTAIAALLASYELVDLSVPYAEELPTMPGHPRFEHKVQSWYAPVDGPQRIASLGPYFDNWMLLDEHSGTHFDAPAHFVPPPGSGLPHAALGIGATYADDVPLAQLQGPAAVIDCRSLLTDELGTSPRVTADFVRAWEAEHGALEPGDVVLIQGSWDARYLPGADGDAYTHGPLFGRATAWPAPDADCVLHCHGRGVRFMGTDAPTIGAADEPLSMHYAGLENNLLFVESLANLDRLPPRGAHFVFLPIRVLRASGGPGRAIAYVPR